MITIVTDSVAAIPAEMRERYKVEVVSLYINYKEKEYLDAEMDLDVFYSKISEMADNPPISSQPSYLDFESKFEAVAERGDFLLGVFISSEMSGTLDGALRTARAVAQEYPEFKYRIVDSTSNSFDEACAVLDACQARENEGDLDSCTQAALNAIPCSRFLFTPESLTFLQKGGRIGGAKALLGNLIKVCSVLTVSNGKAETLAKVRTRKKALAYIVETLKADIESSAGLKRLVVHYIGDKEPAIAWAKKEIEPLLGHKVDVLPVSPVIGLHVGPSVGIAYECNKPVKGKLSIQPETLIFA